MSFDSGEPPRALRALAGAGTVLSVVLGAAAVPLAAPAHAATTLHVAVNGSDNGAGTSVQPFRSVQRAVQAAVPGSTILVHAGTYSGQVVIRESGRADAPITLTSAGDGPVKLSAGFPSRSCSMTSPAVERTVKVKDGASHWTIKGLTIHNGVWVSGANANRFTSWFSQRVAAGDWQTRRRIPGQAQEDRLAARSAVSHVNGVLGLRGDAALVPADGIKILNNTITGRGIHATVARGGAITRNTIRDIECGTGPGVWVAALGSGWLIDRNDVSRVKDSTKHHMQEGIRLGGASSYNRVEGNSVHDLPTDGRGFNTDHDASYNVFVRNRATRVDIGYTDQLGGKGNKWLHNVADGVRKHGFGLMSTNWNSPSPVLGEVTEDVVMRCNTVSGPADWQFVVGEAKGGTFANNSFSSVYIAPNLRTYWAAEGNVWDGATTPPSAQPARVGSAACT